MKMRFSLETNIVFFTTIISYIESYYLSEENPNKYQSLCRKASDCFNLRDRLFVCSRNRCVCDEEYRFDVSDNLCKQFICHQNSDCQESDTNRRCLSGQCLCHRNYSVDSVSKLCVERPGYQYSWLWCLLFLTPSILASVHGIVLKYKLLDKIVPH